MKLVDKDSSLPLYFQLKEIIKDMIENEELIPGEAIPPEREICALQGISRMTVNKAILSLVNEGILFREQGKGTFVSLPKENQPLAQIKSFTEIMEQKGVKTKTTLLSYEIKKATKKVKDKLDLKSNDAEVIKIIRVRYTEDSPMVIETVYLPKRLCPDLTKELIENNSLYDILKQKYKYSLTKAIETIEPIKLTEYEASLLEQSNEALALKFSRVSYTKEGYALEYSKSVLRTDNYKYEIILDK